MTLDEIKRLDPKHIGSWPLPIKLATLVLTFIVVLSFFFITSWQSKWANYTTNQSKEESLKSEYLEKKKLSINLPSHRKRYSEIEAQFTTLLQQLPAKLELDEVLNDLNQAGTARNLKFNLFRPAPKETVKEFYAEQTISLKIVGNYHDLGLFVSDIGKLSRIVSLDDITLSSNNDNTVTLEATAKTFRYIEDKKNTEINKKPGDIKSWGTTVL